MGNTPTSVDEINTLHWMTQKQKRHHLFYGFVRDEYDEIVPSDIMQLIQKYIGDKSYFIVESNHEIEQAI